MFAALIPYKWMLEVGLIVLMFIVAAFGIHSVLQYGQKEGYERAVAEYTKKQLVAEQMARAKEKNLNNQITKARNAAIKRDQEMDKLADALNTANQRLRYTTTTLRNKLSTDSSDALRRTADAALTVFDRCTEEYTRMAEDATGHANDVLTLTEAWPTNEPD